MTTDSLFPEITAPAAAPALSRDRRRTMRQLADVSRGVHPLERGPLTTVPGATCGTCVHLVKRGPWLKCSLIPVTNGAGTDARRWWPGCTKWQPLA